MASAPNQNNSNDNEQHRDVPVDVDKKRPPQLNETICRLCGCKCPCTSDDGEGRAYGGGQRMKDRNLLTSAASIASSENGSVIDGDEGLGDHQIEVGDFGMISLRDIHMALARHQKCDCHGGILPEAEDYPFSSWDSPSASCFLPPDSVRAQYDSGSSDVPRTASIAPSSHSGLAHSTNNVLNWVGAVFDGDLAQSLAGSDFSTQPGFRNADTEMETPELTDGSDRSSYDIW